MLLVSEIQNSVYNTCLFVHVLWDSTVCVCHAVSKCVTRLVDMKVYVLYVSFVRVCKHMALRVVCLVLANANGHIMMNWLHDFS